MRLVVALVSIAGCSGGDPSPDAELSLVPADYSSFSEVQGCRNSVDHELTKIRTLADPSTKNAFLGRMPFPTGGIFIAEERDSDETTCTGPILSWAIMIKLEDGSSPSTHDFQWQRVRASDNQVITPSVPRCVNCHSLCEPPDFYGYACSVP